MRASLVVPTLNEAASIAHVLESFDAAVERANAEIFAADPVQWERIVVDGRSTDDTVDIARAHGARVVLERRPGYGRAYRSGFEAATGEFIATVDGDATYPVERAPTLLRRLLDLQLDFITGDRLRDIDRKAMTTEHRIGNWMLNSFLRIAYKRYFSGVPGGTLRDSQSGMWVFRREILPKLQLTQDGMPFSEELKIEVVLRGFRLEEVPIPYRERWGAPKLSSWRDGRRNLQFLLEKRLQIQHDERRLGLRAAIAHRKRAPQ